MGQRRSRPALEGELREAETRRERAMASYQLGLFHHNNDRFGEAIPLFRDAIAMGLSNSMEARAHAWLAGSLYRNGSPGPALDHVRAARKRTKEFDLLRLLDRLEARCARKLMQRRTQAGA